MSAYKKYFVKKFMWYFLTFIIAIALNFFLPRLMPGNPVDTIVSKMATPGMDLASYKEIYESFVSQFGIDKPLIVQFFIYLGNLLQGDLGYSFAMYPVTVGEIIGKSLPWTIGLQLPAIILGWLVGNFLGAIAAYKKGIFDKVLMPLSLFVSAVPFFAFSLILLYIFGINLEWFPIEGGFDKLVNQEFSLEFISSVLSHYILPFMSIFLVAIGGQAIGMREMSIYELNADYVLYSKLSGLKDSKIIKYVFRNAVLPQITGLAQALGTMVGGALITEIVFNYPGLGTTLFKAITSRDYPVISACTLIVTLTVLFANFLLEIVYGFIDPRIKAAQLEEG